MSACRFFIEWGREYVSERERVKVREGYHRLLIPWHVASSCLQISTWGTHHVLVSPCKLEVSKLGKRKTITGSHNFMRSWVMVTQQKLVRWCLHAKTRSITYRDALFFFSLLPPDLDRQEQVQKSPKSCINYQGVQERLYFGAYWESVWTRGPSPNLRSVSEDRKRKSWQ